MRPKRFIRKALRLKSDGVKRILEEPDRLVAEIE
jgi:hypothetical protein